MPHVFFLAIELWRTEANAREKVEQRRISLTFVQNQIRLTMVSHASRSNKSRKVDMSYIALATNALAIATLSFTGLSYRRK